MPGQSSLRRLRKLVCDAGNPRLSYAKKEGRGWPGEASGSDAVLRTALPGHDEKRTAFMPTSLNTLGAFR
jgi:hypothetical protein